MSLDPRPETGISIVCVYNDLEVRKVCLDRSIAAYEGPVDVDYIPVDNTQHAFSTAGAALNHGARSARHEVVVFAHQDVYFHSIDLVAAQAAHFRGETWGMLGACGSPARGDNIGRMRDRLQLIGAHAPRPLAVDSVDEVVFLARRDRLLAHPLTQDPDLAWHAYAVEYALRMRELGLSVGAVDLGVTHNSLTINLARFREAHRRVARLYPDLLPVRTTCGTVSEGEGWRKVPLLRAHAWRLRWLHQSIRAAWIRRGIHVPVVLSDIRDDVDLLDYSSHEPLHVINVDSIGGFAVHGRGSIILPRRDRLVRMSSVASVKELTDVLTNLSPQESVLVADLSIRQLKQVQDHLDGAMGWVAGVQHGAVWLLGGRASRVQPAEWRTARSRPLRLRGVRATA